MKTAGMILVVGELMLGVTASLGLVVLALCLSATLGSCSKRPSS